MGRTYERGRERVINVEGADGSGKTTLAKLLADELDLEYTRPPAELLDSVTGAHYGLASWWTKQLQQGSQPISSRRIYDRCFFISEPIYSTVMNRPASVPANFIAYQMSMAINAVDLLIFCIPDRHVVKGDQLKGMTKRRQELTQFAYAVAYTSWAWSPISNRVWRYNWHNGDQTIKRVKEALSGKNRRTSN
jgi:hypothetical protein